MNFGDSEIIRSYLEPVLFQGLKQGGVNAHSKQEKQLILDELQSQLGGDLIRACADALSESERKSFQELLKNSATTEDVFHFLESRIIDLPQILLRVCEHFRNYFLDE